VAVHRIGSVVTQPRTELEMLLDDNVGSARLDLDTVAAPLPLLDEVVAVAANGAP
jgi:hypothetical protein